MKLHVVYRSVGSENEKNRPPFYDKTLALASLLRAAERSGLSNELVFVNDGPIPLQRLDLMVAAGEVVQVSCGSNRASLRRALTFPRERGWEPDDLVWFAEDDYLYAPQAFAAVVAAARELRHADYFAHYSEPLFDPATRLSAGIEIRSRADGDRNAVPLVHPRWYDAPNTTSTFGARVRTLLADEWLLRTVPFTGGAFDCTTFLTLRGCIPFGLNELGGEPLDPRKASAAQRAVRRVALTAVRLALDAVALARPARARRILVAPEPQLATHMERGRLAPGTDWAAETALVADWLRTHRQYDC